MFGFISSPILIILIVLCTGFFLSLTLVSDAQLPFVRRLCLGASLVALSVGVAAALFFDKATIGFQFMSTFYLVPQANLSLALGVDGLSFVFLILTLITFPPLFLAA